MCSEEKRVLTEGKMRCRCWKVKQPSRYEGFWNRGHEIHVPPIVMIEVRLNLEMRGQIPTHSDLWS